MAKEQVTWLYNNDIWYKKVEKTLLYKQKKQLYNTLYIMAPEHVRRLYNIAI